MKKTVTVKALSEVSRILGWEERKLEFEGSTIGELLKSVVANGGQTLYDLAVKGDKLTGDFVVSLNGQVVTRLDTPVAPGDRILTMEMVRVFQGG